MLEGMTDAERALLVALHRDATMGRLMASVLHELRNPLNSIRNGAQLLAERGDLQAMRDKLLPVLTRSSGAMVDVLDALDLSRVKKEGDRPVDLHQTLASCMGVVSCAMRYLEYHPTGVNEEALVDVDPDLLWTLLLSILETSAHSNPKNLWVRSEAKGETQVLVIEHDGPTSEPNPSMGTQSAGLVMELSRILLSKTEASTLECCPREPQGSRITLRLRRLSSRSNEQDPLRR
jgi:signal transduction histidine kinase